MSWLSWHAFRNMHATLTQIAGMSDEDLMKMMGHGSLSITDRSTHAETDGRRAIYDVMVERLIWSQKPKLARAK